MYSEIKSSEKILINRLDENEKIILEDIYKKSNDAKIDFEKLTDESGDFGGVMINIKSDDTKSIEIIDEIPKAISLNIGKTTSIPVNTNIEGVTPTIYTGSNNNSIEVSVQDNSINVEGITLTDTPVKLYYSVSADEYKTLNGEIEVSVSKKEAQRVNINVTMSGSGTTEDITDVCNIKLTDSNDTEYILEYDSDTAVYYADLPVGHYILVARLKSNDTYIGDSTFDITEESLVNPDSTEITIVGQSK